MTRRQLWVAPLLLVASATCLVAAAVTLDRGESAGLLVAGLGLGLLALCAADATNGRDD